MFCGHRTASSRFGGQWGRWSASTLITAVGRQKPSLQLFIFHFGGRVWQRPKWPNKQNATKTNNSSALDLLGTNYRQICALLLLMLLCCTLLLIEQYKVFCKLLYLHESHAVQRNLLISENKKKYFACGALPRVYSSLNAFHHLGYSHSISGAWNSFNGNVCALIKIENCIQNVLHGFEQSSGMCRHLSPRDPSTPRIDFVPFAFHFT